MPSHLLEAAVCLALQQERARWQPPACSGHLHRLCWSCVLLLLRTMCHHRNNLVQLCTSTRPVQFASLSALQCKLLRL
jgi:hypothetical protein